MQKSSDSIMWAQRASKFWAALPPAAGRGAGRVSSWVPGCSISSFLSPSTSSIRSRAELSPSQSFSPKRLSKAGKHSPLPRGGGAGRVPVLSRSVRGIHRFPGNRKLPCAIASKENLTDDNKEEFIVNLVTGNGAPTAWGRCEGWAASGGPSRFVHAGRGQLFLRSPSRLKRSGDHAGNGLGGGEGLMAPGRGPAPTLGRELAPWRLQGAWRRPWEMGQPCGWSKEGLRPLISGRAQPSLGRRGLRSPRRRPPFCGAGEVGIALGAVKEVRPQKDAGAGDDSSVGSRELRARELEATLSTSTRAAARVRGIEGGAAPVEQAAADLPCVAWTAHSGTAGFSVAGPKWSQTEGVLRSPMPARRFRHPLS